MSKNRNLTILEFYNELLYEWAVADFRSRVYDNKAEKKEWRSKAKNKEAKILDIARRNKIPNPFDDPETKKDLYNKYYPRGEMPRVIENDRDLECYLEEGNDAIIEDEDGPKFGRIMASDAEKREAIIYIYAEETQRRLKIGEFRRML